MLEKVVFLDRDGVINEDSPNYVKNWKEFHFIPGSLDAIKKLHDNHFTTIVITNQSVVGRKISSPENLDEIHRNMSDAVKRHGGSLRDIFFCPHRPEDGCVCRKPKPEMIFQAQKKYDINLSTACMVGDSAKDIECALNAGLKHALLVKTGNGTRAEIILKEKKIIPDFVAEDLKDAVEWIVDTGY